MKSVFKIVGLFMVISLLLIPIRVDATANQGDEIPPMPQKDLEMVPEEVSALFEGGMSMDEFLAIHRGPLPNAILELTDYPVPVIVRTAGIPLAEHILGTVGRVEEMTPMAQQAYVQTLLDAQAPLVASGQSLGGVLVSQYTKAFNGFQMVLPAHQIDALRAQPGVEYVVQAVQYEPALENSVPLINADDVWSYDTGFTGDGITIAIIDSGIDYYHAALEGTGLASDFTSDDHTIIESGTFPTAKVIGGTDFAGTDYNASDPANSIPTPDPDPVDEMGHGTHVASIAAGVEVTGEIGPGVAPDAKLLAVKIFGACSTCTTTLTLDGIEYAMDPNGDGVMNDHVDVINMSLGSAFGTYDPVMDPELMSVENAVDLGIVVAAAAGNAGDVNYIVGSPSVADSAISVAGSTTGYKYGATVLVDTGANAGDAFVYYPADFDDPSPSFDADLTADLVDVDAYDGASFEGTFCNDADNGNETILTPVDILDGKIALISRGGSEEGCAFSHKVNNAAAQGAVAVLIYNNEAGVITMIGDPVTIPAASLEQADGLALAASDGEQVTIHDEDSINMVAMADPADSVYPASSRGPRGFDSHLKPEITAPGMNIFAAEIGTGNGGVSYSGTSMATPHVAGVAALLMQAHPTWTPEMVKAAMMNTAVDLVEWAPAEVVVPRQGAGRVDALAAVQSDFLAVGMDGLVSVTFGYQELTQQITTLSQPVTLTNLTASAVTVDLNAYFTSPSSAGASFVGLPSGLVVPANNSVTVDVTMQLDTTLFASASWTEYYGYLTIAEASPGVDIRLPFYIVPRPVAELTVDAVNNTLTAGSPVGSIDVTNTGPYASNFWMWPLVDEDPNESGQIDSGDLRLMGIDYGWQYSATGTIFGVFLSAWDDIYLPQPFYVEYDLYMDVDEDGTDDWVAFNYDAGQVFYGAYDNFWMVMQVDLATNTLYQGSPYKIFSDFNADYQEWYLLDVWYGMDIIGATNPDFDYQLYVFDMAGNVDAGDPGSADVSGFSLNWGFSSGTWYASDTAFFVINDQTLVDYNGVNGVILADYAAAPGTAQAHRFPFWQNPIYIPCLCND